MRVAAGPLMIVAARARRCRTWILPGLALALVFGFAGALASESVIVGDQGARATLRALAPTDRALRLVWEGPVSPYASRTASRLFASLGVQRPTELLLLNPVRLSQAIVHPVAIAPAGHWLPARAMRRLGPCRPNDCPVLQGSPGRVPRVMATAGVRMRAVGQVALSPVLLGYSPRGQGNWPIVLTGDVHGLNALAGLGGVYRTVSWEAPLPLGRLHSWNLAGLDSRLLDAQAALSQQSRFTLEAPFFALNRARNQASLALHRLLLVDGGLVVSLVLFVLLAAGALQRDQQAEIERLRQAGGKGLHTLLFLLAEAAWISAAAILVGLGLAVLFSAALATGADESPAAVLGHGLFSWAGAGGLAGGWLLTAAVLTLAPLVRGGRIADLAALAAGAVLIAGLILGTGSSSAWVGLFVPLACLACGLLLFRATGLILGIAERVSRRSKLTVRLALIGLGRGRGIAALAIAFLAISSALGAFALAFRATLIRGAADQAADSVPLDALVAAGSSLAGPLEVAPLSRWQALSHGRVFVVRRAEASYPDGGATASVPALGVPPAALALMHGWRSSDGEAPLSVLASRLRRPGPARRPGPILPARAQWLALPVHSANLDLNVSLDLRNRQGAVRQLPLGESGLRTRVLSAGVPGGGPWEVEAIELSELSGTAITNGHQNGENPAPATQFSAQLRLGPLLIEDGSRHPLLRAPLGSWRAVGAASNASLQATDTRAATALTFQTTGWPGFIRPPQPSDTRPLPILVDPTTAAAAGPGRQIGLTVDGAPIQGHVVGILRRFPTTLAAGGFVLADQALLSSALDAQLPGQGQPDELWISTSKPGRFADALRGSPLGQLSISLRENIESRLRSQPIAAGVSATLLASGLVATLLALLGMLLVLAGPLRQARIAADLEAQGLGPSGLRGELRLRFAIACLLGIWPGLLIALILDRLAVATVGAYENGGSQLSLITVIPWPELLAVGVGLSAICLLGGWALSEVLLPRRQRNSGRQRMAMGPRVDELAKEPLP
jgi:hypothetical protein